LFRRLGVFVGGASLSAIQAVCSNGASGLDVLNPVESLVAKSLLHEDDHPQAEPRFRMLETIRHFALERLAAVVGSGGAPQCVQPSSGGGAPRVRGPHEEGRSAQEPTCPRRGLVRQEAKSRTAFFRAVAARPSARSSTDHPRERLRAAAVVVAAGGSLSPVLPALDAAWPESLTGHCP
jgi:hypothetical protein